MLYTFIVSNAHLILRSQVSFALLLKQCLSYFTVTIPGLTEFNVTTPNIESGSANFTLSLNDSMVEACVRRQAIFHGSGLMNSVEVDIKLPSGKQCVVDTYKQILMLYILSESC